MTKKDGKVYGLIGGVASIVFLFIINPQTNIGNVILSLTYLLTIAIAIIGITLFFWGLIKSKAMLGTTFDHFIYTYLGVLVVYSAGVAIMNGQAPSPV